MILVRFGLIGLFNTAIGLAVIMAGLAAGLGDYTANALGYAFGLTFSYFANRRWTFAAKGPATADEFTRFVTCFALAYAGNLLVMLVFRNMGLVGNPAVHVAGMAVYSVLFFALSRRFTFGDDRPLIKSVKPARWQAYLPEIVIGVFAILAFAVLQFIPITNDVVWQFWIARHLLHGARLYADIWEVNPPLWFWSAVPVQYLADLLHVPPLHMLVAVVIVCGAIASCLVGHLGGYASPQRRLAVMLSMFWIVVITPLADFGQREQLALVFALPYAALIARRSWIKVPGHAVPWALAIFIGATAAYGFALKHYFVLIPVMLEIWLFFRNRADWRLLRPETVTLVLAALAYGVCIVLFAPEFLTRMVPMILVAYDGIATPWIDNLLGLWVPGWVFVAGWFACNGGAFGKRADPLVSAVLIVGAGFVATYFLEAKAWHYHAMPATAALGVALAIRLVGMPLRRSMALLFAAAILGPQLASPLLGRTYYNQWRPEVEPILHTIPAGEPVLIVGAHPSWTWPAVEDDHLVWPSRLYAYWMIPAIAHAEIIGPYPDTLRTLGQQMQQELALELRCSAPAVVLFERRTMYSAQPASFDERAFFLRNPETRQFLAHNYREVAPTLYMVIYRRLPGVQPIRDQTCPKTL